MPKGIGGTILKLVLASLAVGWLMYQFDITPRSLVQNFGENVERIYDWARGLVSWAIPYLLLGAAIVVPIWLVIKGLEWLRLRARR